MGGGRGLIFDKLGWKMESKGKLFFLFDNCFPKILSLIPPKKFYSPNSAKKKPQNKISLCATIHNFWKNKWFSKGVTINFSRKFTPLRSQQTRIEAELRPRSMFYLNLMNMVGVKEVPWQTPERQTPDKTNSWNYEIFLWMKYDKIQKL